MKIELEKMRIDNIRSMILIIKGIVDTTISTTKGDIIKNKIWYITLSLIILVSLYPTYITIGKYVYMRALPIVSTSVLLASIVCAIISAVIYNIAKSYAKSIDRDVNKTSIDRAKKKDLISLLHTIDNKQKEMLIYTTVKTYNIKWITGLIGHAVAMYILILIGVLVSKMNEKGAYEILYCLSVSAIAYSILTITNGILTSLSNNSMIGMEVESALVSPIISKNNDIHKVTDSNDKVIH